MKWNAGLFLLALLGVASLRPAFSAEESPPAGQWGDSSLADLSLTNSAIHSLNIATEFLVGAQNPDGSWVHDPAITALAVYSLLLAPMFDREGPTDQAIDRGLDFIVGFTKPDGGIYDKEYAHYVTSVCLLALTEYNSGEHQAIIERGKEFLIAYQIDEGEGIDSSHPYYGGIGYGGDDRPDLSNTHMALEGIKAAEDYEARFASLTAASSVEIEDTEPGLHWEKALTFVSRCQNSPAANDLEYAGNDGGFLYETGLYKQDRSHSYGSMTYAGVKSLLYAKVDRNDQRVLQAVDWITKNYTLDFNPGFGTDSLFYYYMTFAKCLDALGRDIIVDVMGLEHRWREDLVGKLVSIQDSGGFWQNPSNRYWENIKELATAYSIIGMKFALYSQTDR